MFSPRRARHFAHPERRRDLVRDLVGARSARCAEVARRGAVLAVARGFALVALLLLLFDTQLADTAEQVEVAPARAGLEELALLCRLAQVVRGAPLRDDA